MKTIIKNAAFLAVLAFSPLTFANLIYDFVEDQSNNVLGSIELLESLSDVFYFDISETGPWGPENHRFAIADFNWFDDNSGFSADTGLANSGASIPGAIYSLTGERIDGGRIQIDTNLFNIGSPGDDFSSLAYDIFSNSVARREYDNNGFLTVVDSWEGMWIARSQNVSVVSEPPSSAVFFLTMFLVFATRLKIAKQL